MPGGCQSYRNFEPIYHRDRQTTSIKSGYFVGKIKQAQVETEFCRRIIGKSERGTRLAESTMWKWTHTSRNYLKWARKVGKNSWIVNFGPLAKRNCFGRKIWKSWGTSQRRAPEIVANIRRIGSIQGHKRSLWRKTWPERRWNLKDYQTTWNSIAKSD